MKPPPVSDSPKSFTNKVASSPDARRFREVHDLKTEKTEEREEKKRSIFEIAAEENKSFCTSILFQTAQDSLAVSSYETKIVSLSKVQCDWIVSESTCAISHSIQTGVKETSLLLDGVAFAGSPLHGVELIVKEFSTAPLAFNIEFRCSATALNFLSPHLAELTAAFHGSGKPKGYSIHRIDALYEDASPFLFHRKPPAEGGSAL